MMVQGIETMLSAQTGRISDAGQGAGQPFGEAMRSLGGSLRDGDLARARASFETLTSLRESRQDARPQSGAAGGDGTRASRLDATMQEVGAALEAGDIEAAREAYQGGRPQGATPAGGGAGQGRANGPPPEVGAAVGAFVGALQTEESGAVESAFDTLVALIEEQTAATGDDETEDEANGALERFRDMLASLQPAVESGNVEATRSGFQAFGRHGGLPPLDIMA